MRSVRQLELSPFGRKLQRVRRCDSADWALLDSLVEDVVDIRAGGFIVDHNQDRISWYVIHDGWAIGYILYEDGRRQIVSLLPPGDTVGFPAMSGRRPIHPVVALTDAVAARWTPTALDQIAKRRPTLATAIVTVSTHELALLAEQALRLGRNGAYEKIAHLLLELWLRLAYVGLVNGAAFECPLTQEVIGDYLGLTSVHVSRTLKALQQEGLVTLRRGHVVLHDIPGLVRACDYQPVFFPELAAMLPGSDRRGSAK